MPWHLSVCIQSSLRCRRESSSHGPIGGGTKENILQVGIEDTAKVCIHRMETFML
jgi:hypothetical protein